MRIDSVVIENVKCFKNRTEIKFSPKLNVIIGPNGAGKSTLMDCVTMIMRKYFLYQYNFNVNARKFEQKKSFDDIGNRLGKHFDNNRQSQIVGLRFTVTRRDIDNLDHIQRDFEKIDSEIGQHTANAPLIKIWRSKLNENDKLEYVVTNWAEPPCADQSKEQCFMYYLRSIQMIMGLPSAPKSLLPPLVYISPYRQPSSGFAANGTQPFINSLQSLNNLCSSEATSLFGITAAYFIEKLVWLTKGDGEQGAVKKFDQDEEVMTLREYLRRIGIEWTVRNTEWRTRAYEIQLKRDGRDLNLNQGSSGEREIVHLIFAAFCVGLNGGCIMIDEPELHLHPRLQTTLIETLADLIEKTNGQLIVNTHSPVFVTPKTIASVTRLFHQDKHIRTAAVGEASLPAARDLIAMVNSMNNEKMFFADKVILVEGITDRIVFNLLLSALIRPTAKVGGEVIEIVDVAGKSNLEKYREFLQKLGAKAFIIADLDYTRQIGGAELGDVFLPNAPVARVLQQKHSNDYAALELLVRKALETNDVTKLGDLVKYFDSRHATLKKELGDPEKARFAAFLEKKKTEGIFILARGEIEDYLPDRYSSLDSIAEAKKEDLVAAFATKQTEKDELDTILKAIIAA